MLTTATLAVGALFAWSQVRTLQAENDLLRSQLAQASLTTTTTALVGASGDSDHDASNSHGVPTPEQLCTCEEAQKSPLLLEYAYRTGLCEGAPKELGPDFATEDCLEDINKEYNTGGAFNGARPVLFDPTTAHEYEVFRGVRHVRLPPGEVTEQWECSEANGCHDCDEEGSPTQCSRERGYAMLWVPDGADASTPRILYVHGGSWLTGSPTVGTRRCISNR